MDCTEIRAETELFMGFQGRCADSVKNGATERPFIATYPGGVGIDENERPAT